MKRKITSILLAVIMILSLAPCAFAETIASGDCGDNATWTLDSDGTLTISGTGPAYSSRFSQNDDIKKVVVGEGITEVHSFRFDENLTEVSLPSTLTELSLSIFSGCISLKKLTIPAGVSYIGISEDNTQLFVDEFIVDEANEEYKAVDGVLFTKDGERLVMYPPAKAGESYTVPEGVITLGSVAFSNAPSLKTVNLPSSVRASNGSFYNCENLENINVDENNERMTSVDGVLYSKDMTILYRHPARNNSNFDVPDSVNDLHSFAFEGTSIEEFCGGENILSMGISVFENCRSLKSVTIDGQIGYIERRCFKNCRTMENINMPDTVESIGEEAFYNCYSLKNIKLPASLVAIDEYAFGGCDAITTVKCPDKVQTIGYCAFEKCTELTSIYLPKNIESVGEDAFKTTMLADIYYDGTENDWSYAVLDYDLVREINRGNITVHFIAKPSISGDITYADGTITVPITATELDCILMAAVYKDNALVNVVSKPLAKNASSDSITVTADGTDEIAVFIWDSFSGATPMCESASIPYVGTISGTVKSGGVISGANLGLYNSNHKLVAKTQSDENGNFTFENVPAGAGYFISASYSDYPLQRAGDIVVKAGENTAVQIVLIAGDRVA